MNVTLFGNRIFANDQVNMRSLELALIQYDMSLGKDGVWKQRHAYKEKLYTNEGRDLGGYNHKPRDAKDCQPTTRSLETSMGQIFPHGPQKEPTLLTL